MKKNLIHLPLLFLLSVSCRTSPELKPSTFSTSGQTKKEITPLSVLTSNLGTTSPAVLNTAPQEWRLVHTEKLAVSEFSGKLDHPTAYLLKWRLDLKGPWDFLGGMKLTDNPSIFYPVEQVDYAMEIWDGKKVIFQGGIRNPFLARYEREFDRGRWEHKEFLLPATLFTVKIPPVPDKVEVRFYELVQR